MSALAPRRPALVGLKLDLTGSFQDQGTLDTHTASVNWGEATTPGTVAPDSTGGVEGSVTASYAYAGAGNPSVVLSVTDDDTGVGVNSLPSR